MLPLSRNPEEQVDNTFARNVRSRSASLLHCSKMLPLMGQGSSIVLTGSTAGTEGTAAFSICSASGGRPQPRPLWALDLKGTGIRVNVVSPRATRPDSWSLLVMTRKNNSRSDRLPSFPYSARSRR